MLGLQALKCWVYLERGTLGISSLCVAWVVAAFRAAPFHLVALRRSNNPRNGALPISSA